jgi:beta-phosphoglucomutase-like phosphatase (HAD superfamily)
MLPGVKDIMDEVRMPMGEGLLFFIVEFQLYLGSKYPNPCWAICTSATRKYASAALAIVGIPIPDAFVTAEDVSQGKPMSVSHFIPTFH